ncbi:MAG: hypothetical protein VX948_18420 [Candidatus Latescibacterota bacterium]|nr:hypothetical protein [Candidatus Latescibacterota bacterium]
MLAQPFALPKIGLLPSIAIDKEPYDGDWENGCPAKYIGYDLYLSDRTPILGDDERDVSQSFQLLHLSLEALDLRSDQPPIRENHAGATWRCSFLTMPQK